MNRIKKQKGITLLILVIIVIVLLIISTVTIGSMKNNNIVGYTQDAAKAYTESENNEEIMWDEGIEFIEELKNEDKIKDESGDESGDGTGDVTGGEDETENGGKPEEDGTGDVTEEVYYDISFLDLSTSGWSSITLPTETEKLIFMFENSNNEKGFISIQDGSVAYFEKMNNVNIYSYASAINQWLYVETKEFVSTPPSISNVKIITDNSIIDAALRELLDAEEEMYTWDYMTNEQIDKIISLTVHQEI